jgi:O-succinylbenzoate synthase
MKQTLTVSDIAEQLRRDDNANWSPAGAQALAEYLDESYEDNAEFDRVEIRCDHSEYKGLREWAEEFFGSISAWESRLGVEPDTLPDDVDDKIRNYISDHGGILIEFDGGIIVSSF